MADSYRLLLVLRHHPSKDGTCLLHLQQPINEEEGQLIEDFFIDYM